MSGSKAVLGSGIEALKEELVADAIEDYTDLSFYVAGVEEAFGVSDSSELMLYTAAVVHSLLDDDLVRAGDLTKEGFIPWEEDAAGAVERILASWRELGRRPHLWEIVWFEATDKGTAYAEEALSNSG
jgi:hypothetical protein